MMDNKFGIRRKSYTEKNNRLVELENKIAADSFNNKQIFKEAKAIFPEIISLSVSKHHFYFNNDSTVLSTVLLYKADKELDETDKQKLDAWLKEKLPKQPVKVIYEN